MSNRTLLIWLAIALVLAGLGWLVLKGNSGMSVSGGGAASSLLAPGDKLVTFLPSEIVSIDVSRPGSTKELLHKDPDTGVWMLTIGDSHADWLISQGRVEGLLRQLSSATAVAAAEKGMELGDKPTVVTFGRANGSPITLRFASAALGGTVLAQVDALPETPSPGGGVPGTPAVPQRRAVVPAELHDVFRNPGPRIWRETAALPGLDPNISRLSMQSAGNSVAFARQGNRWVIAQPDTAAGSTADPRTVLALLNLLGSVSIADFLDEGVSDGASTGLDSPAARIVIETDRRSFAAENDAIEEEDGGLKLNVTRHELSIGGPCGTGGTQGERLYASISDSGHAEGARDGRLVCIDAKGIAGLALDPVAYLSPRMSEVQVSDIGTVAIEPYSETAGGMEGKLIQRRLGKWVIVRQDGSETVLPDAEAGPVDALLAFLTATPGGVDEAVRVAREAGTKSTGAAGELHLAPTIGMGEGTSRRGGEAMGFRMSLAAPASYTPTGRIMLLSLAGSPLERIELGLLPGGRLLCKTGKVYRSYPVDVVPQVLAGLAVPGGGTIGSGGKPPLTPEEKAKLPVETGK